MALQSELKMKNSSWYKDDADTRYFDWKVLRISVTVQYLYHQQGKWQMKNWVMVVMAERKVNDDVVIVDERMTLKNAFALCCHARMRI